MNRGAFNVWVAWIALIIAIVALGIGWYAYNRSEEETIIPQVEEQIRTTQQETGKLMAKMEARIRLMALRGQIAAEESYEELSQEVSEIRSDLAAAYEDTSADVREEWEELDSDLQQLVDNLEEESNEAIDSLEEAINSLRQNTGSS